METSLGELSRRGVDTHNRVVIQTLRGRNHLRPHVRLKNQRRHTAESEITREGRKRNWPASFASEINAVQIEHGTKERRSGPGKKEKETSDARDPCLNKVKRMGAIRKHPSPLPKTCGANERRKRQVPWGGSPELTK